MITQVNVRLFPKDPKKTPFSEDHLKGVSINYLVKYVLSRFSRLRNLSLFDLVLGMVTDVNDHGLGPAS